MISATIKRTLNEFIADISNIKNDWELPFDKDCNEIYAFESLIKLPAFKPIPQPLFPGHRE